MSRYSRFHKKFTGHLYFWDNNVLTRVEQMFDDMERALDYCERSAANSFKIYDTEDNICHSKKNHQQRKDDHHDHHDHHGHHGHHDHQYA